MASRFLTRGTRDFLLVWCGQLLSVVGSGVTTFAMGVWVYQQTGSATQFALLSLFATLPGIVLLPFAGAFVDRWDRRRTMLGSNALAAVCKLALVLLLVTARLELWHVYVTTTVIAAGGTVLTLAFTASIPYLVPKSYFARASGMVQGAQAAALIFSPLLAGMLMSRVSLQEIILMDLGSYLFAVAGLLLAAIPRPESAAAAKPSLLREATYGWTYIWNRRGLLALLLYFGAVNFVVSIARVLLTPLVLNFSTVEVLSFLTSVSGVGFLCGSLVMAVWGGPRIRIRGVLGFGLLFGLSVLLIGLRPSFVVLYAAVFCMYASVPVINACSQAIWQSKTPPDAQGRVFAVRWLVSLSAAPVAYLLAGFLVERVFEPLAAIGAPMLKALGRGAGQGTGLVFIAAGLLMMLAQLGGYLFPRLRRVEMELPDVVPEANA